MPIHLGSNQYGKAENRVVRIYRDTPRHQIRDLNVSTALRGSFDDVVAFQERCFPDELIQIERTSESWSMRREAIAG